MNETRSLASIRRISELQEIEGADNILCAVIDGWTLVTQKSNNFQVGDLVIYFEPDSVLPELEEFEFLRDRCWVSENNSVNGPGFRLRTIRLRGVYSNGLILPVESLAYRIGDKTLLNEGLDLTDIIGVVKYEKPLPANLAGVARGNFPSFIPKTDAERIQNFYKTFDRNYRDHLFEVTLKLDGSSCTMYYHQDQFGVCSRNLDLEESEDNSFWQVARKYDTEAHLRRYGKSLAIQGELMGPGIQGNKENYKELHFFVFNIWDIERQEYLDPVSRRDLVMYLGLENIPKIEYRKFDDFDSAGTFLAYAEGPSIWAKQREGIVFKSISDPSVSFKAISEKWLIKND